MRAPTFESGRVGAVHGVGAARTSTRAPCRRLEHYFMRDHPERHASLAHDFTK